MATAASASAAAVKGGGTAAAAAAAAATAAVADTVATKEAVAGGGGNGGRYGGGVTAGGGWDDRGRQPQTTPPPSAGWASMVLPGGRLPPFQELFPADGAAAAAAGRAKRERPVWEQDKGGGEEAGDAEMEGEVKGGRPGGAPLSGPPAADVGRASKRRTWASGGRWPGGRGVGGCPDGGGSSGWVFVPAPAFLSPTTDGGGSPWGASPVAATAATPVGPPGRSGSPVTAAVAAAAAVTAAAAAATSTGATTPPGRRWGATRGAGAASQPREAVSTSPPSVGQRLQYWSTVLAETSAGAAAGGLEGGSSPVEPSPSTADGDGGWRGWPPAGGGGGGGSPTGSPSLTCG